MSALRASRFVRPTTSLSSLHLRNQTIVCGGFGLRATRSFASTACRLDKNNKRVQSVSPLGPLGVEAALKAANDPSFKPRPTIQKEFDLTGRVAVVSGGNRGLGLEMAETLCEQGATVYCLDLPSQPGKEWSATRDYVKKMNVKGAKLEYASVDVTDQKAVWDAVAKIGDKEKRMDACVAAAGILQGFDCLEYPAEEFQKVMNVNVHGVLYTAQAVGRQMTRFGTPGSIILIASMSGSITNRDHAWVAYNTSKSAVIQMGRSMACELGPKRIRVNTLSPGHIYTNMTAAYLDKYPELFDKWSNLNPLGRLGRPDELRGVVAWLASDASTFCTGSDILVSGGHHSW
ncbi:NAD-binding protein [Fomitiporia mediterranea MF3/22]|uniref:NAD-binding protein n=1 Tax=Fomitiporia mediterranea (strain MF3/22) TaxID=694068 RepID=UPI0004408ADD|nr:NAD-binding protein [Fomitiporia mediterranea MF3/22]EJD05911.1 NAD-binding protein [Fomitiporia mediterranea MF3/22]